MKLRIAKELYTSLKKASEVTGFKMSEIARKAFRKFWNKKFLERVEILKTKTTSTYKGQEIELFIPDSLLKEMSAETVRTVITWYLNLHEIKTQKLNISEKGIKRTKEIMTCTKTV